MLKLRNLLLGESFLEVLRDVTWFQTESQFKVACVCIHCHTLLQLRKVLISECMLKAAGADAGLQVDSELRLVV